MILTHSCCLKVLPHVAMKTNKIVRRLTRNYFVHRNGCHTLTKKPSPAKLWISRDCFCFDSKPIILPINVSQFRFLDTSQQKVGKFGGVIFYNYYFTQHELNKEETNFATHQKKLLLKKKEAIFRHREYCVHPINQ